jgi:hypothetical protein
MFTAISHYKGRVLRDFKAKIEGYTLGKMKHFIDL